MSIWLGWTDPKNGALDISVRDSLKDQEGHAFTVHTKPTRVQDVAFRRFEIDPVRVHELRRLSPEISLWTSILIAHKGQTTG